MQFRFGSKTEVSVLLDHLRFTSNERTSPIMGAVFEKGCFGVFNVIQKIVGVNFVRRVSIAVFKSGITIYD